MSDKKYNINELIDINLKLICESNSKEQYCTDFIDKYGNQIDHFNIDPMTIAIEMEEKGLIWRNGDNCKLKSKGEKICKDGGWLKHLEMKKDNQKNKGIYIGGDNKGNISQSDFRNVRKIETKQTVGFPKNRTVNNSNLLTLNSNCHNEKQQI